MAEQEEARRVGVSSHKEGEERRGFGRRGKRGFGGLGVWAGGKSEGVRVRAGVARLRKHSSYLFPHHSITLLIPVLQHCIMGHLYGLNAAAAALSLSSVCAAVGFYHWLR